MQKHQPKKIVQLKHRDNTGVWTALLGEADGGWKVLIEESRYDQWPVYATEAEAEEFLRNALLTAIDQGYLPDAPPN